MYFLLLFFYSRNLLVSAFYTCGSILSLLDTDPMACMPKPYGMRFIKVEARPLSFLFIKGIYI